MEGFLNRITEGDCQELLRKVDDDSVDLVFKEIDD